MGMVFCRGCGKEIHETAPSCPHCGAPQFIPEIDVNRNVIKLIGMAILWMFVFYFGTLFTVGAVVGAFNPTDASAAAQRVAQDIVGPVFLISFFLSVALTVKGILPGTRKPKTHKWK